MFFFKGHRPFRIQKTSFYREYTKNGSYFLAKSHVELLIGTARGRLAAKFLEAGTPLKHVPHALVLKTLK
jgi:hypothetical protein